ncbi:NAD(P)-dependent oxidoreductase [Zhihengliuella salsuginis]|uniref:Epimerase/dehydratase n=1 Tax=Zhihengliuella salsuginis TaxID=578222 RepID=A0ABQ3GHC5_9MICC|nr:NAD(P)H-binding protein [Zhihengliuella salsuginis]GHD05020.1 putative epimerase/dehydratase [Zhihengliuella salsuginis]
MKIAVYGATGMVGSQIVAEALTRGHEVTAVSRSGAEVPGAASFTAELTDLAAYRELGKSHDVVVLSVPTPRDGSDHGPVREAHEEIAETLVPARVFVIGGAGALEVDGVQLHQTEGFPEAYKAEAESFAEILTYYQDSSGVNWTMLAPAPMIAPGERTGEYKVGVNSPVGDSVSTQDFAVAVLDELETPKNENRRFTVAN